MKYQKIYDVLVHGSKWQHACFSFLDGLLYRLYMKLASRLWGSSPPREPGLQAVQNKYRTLQEELARIKEKNRSLAERQRDQLADVLKKNDVELRKGRLFPVRPAPISGQWEAVAEHCCLSGCDLEVYSFASERDALLFSALLETLGYEPRRNMACHQCYTEYSRDMI